MPTFRHTGSTGLVRQRLLAELASAARAPLAVLVAPAGFGKTTLLAHYAHAFDGTVVWITADSVDTDPAALGRRLRRACPVALPAPRHVTDLAEFADDLGEASPGRTLLVVDDAQWLEGSEGERALERMLAAAPPHLHTVVAARRMPGFNVSRHELTGLLIIGPDQMRFRAWEAEELLRDVYREPLPPSDIAALARRLGGWAAGFHLFHLSTRGRPLADRRAAVAALDGRTSLARAYLTRTVLSDLPDDLPDFLVRTCVFDAVTAPRCDELVGRADSHQVLAELERLQAFTTSVDGGRSYRYHEVLRSHLAAILVEELGDAGARRWHVKAAQILEREHAYAEAARSYARAGRWPDVRRLLDRLGARLVEDGVEPWRDLLPAWLVAQDPWLILAESRHLLSRGQVAAAVAGFRKAQAMFTDEEGRAHSQQALSRAAVWLPGLQRPQGPWFAWLRAATQRHPALVAGQADELAGPGGAVVRVVARVLDGDVRSARAALPDATYADDTGVAGLSLRLVRAAVALAGGDQEATGVLAQLALDAEHDVPWIARMARAAAALDGTDQGAKAALAVAEECARDGDPWGKVLAAGAAWLGSAARAEPVDLAELVAECRALDAPVLTAWAEALHALAAAGAELPDAELTAAQAAALARSAGVPGARAAALAASAGSPDRARSFALECGLPRALVDRWLARPAWSASVPSPRVSVEDGVPLTVRCLGGFEVRRAGRPVDWTGVKPRARCLLRLLAMHTGGPVHRDVLVEALWPELPSAAAAHNLHVAVSSLRKLLEPDAARGQARLVVREGDSYRLVMPPRAVSDLGSVRAALDAARRCAAVGDAAGAAHALRDAVAGYRGELLPEDGAAEWVVHERDVLRHAVASAAARLAAVELAAGDTSAAAAAAERCVAIDRYCDEGWRSMIAAYERRGDLGAAARARDRYAEVLAELGVTPAA